MECPEVGHPPGKAPCPVAPDRSQNHPLHRNQAFGACACYENPHRRYLAVLSVCGLDHRVRQRSSPSVADEAVRLRIRAPRRGIFETYHGCNRPPRPAWYPFTLSDLLPALSLQTYNPFPTNSADQPRSPSQFRNHEPRLFHTHTSPPELFYAFVDPAYGLSDFGRDDVEGEVREEWVELMNGDMVDLDG